jgi:hypothetical protein
MYFLLPNSDWWRIKTELEQEKERKTERKKESKKERKKASKMCIQWAQGKNKRE